VQSRSAPVLPSKPTDSDISTCEDCFVGLTREWLGRQTDSADHIKCPVQQILMTSSALFLTETKEAAPRDYRLESAINLASRKFPAVPTLCIRNLRTHGATLPFYKEDSGWVQYQGTVDTGDRPEQASVYVPTSWLPDERQAEIQIVVIVPGELS
jgi:hypothetical protein